MGPDGCKYPHVLGFPQEFRRYAFSPHHFCLNADDQLRGDRKGKIGILGYIYMECLEIRAYPGDSFTSHREEWARDWFDTYTTEHYTPL
jgi:hypothetical protein